jgi:hypothetical protein
MMTKLHENKGLQLLLGLLAGICFGFLLHKGGVTKYDIIVGQLRLQDFTVLKIMLSAVIVTMMGVSFLYPKGLIKLHVKAGSVKNSIIGGLIFGVGFAILGYCPGTIAGAVGNGYIDGLLGGVIGILVGSGLFASMYGVLKRHNILSEDRYSKKSLFDEMDGRSFRYTIPMVLVLIIIILLVEFLAG